MASGWMNGDWRRSSGCTLGDCVEVTELVSGVVAVRNSRTPETVVAFTRQEWAAFLAGVRAGEFDLPA